MVVGLLLPWCCVIGYRITLKVSKSKYKIHQPLVRQTDRHQGRGVGRAPFLCVSLHFFARLITSAEEGAYVFTSVCSSDRRITEKVVNGF